MGVLLTALAVAVSILVYLDIHREKLKDWMSPEPGGTKQDLPGSNLKQHHERFDTHLQSLFSTYHIEAQSVHVQSRTETFKGSSFVFKRFEVTVPEKRVLSAIQKDFNTFVKSIPGGLLITRREVSGKEEQTTLSLRIEEKVTRQLVLFVSREALVRKPPPGSQGRVAIIIDDIGQSLEPVKELLSMDVPFTFSILPGLRHSVDAARMIHKQEREVMLHLPMEPLDKGNGSHHEELLTVLMNPREIKSRVDQQLDRIPYLAGVNNHMGSRFTQDRARIAVVLEEVKKRDLFFVDSLTIHDSVAFEESLRLGLRTAKRDIFLDHVDRTQSIALQIDKLIQLSRQQGYAIAICHPRKNTIHALREAIKKFQSQGIVIVPASELTDLS